MWRTLKLQSCERIGRGIDHFLALGKLSNIFSKLDVKTAFLNGDLDEHVWVMSPRGIHGRKSRCYKLQKAMYGLKQAHLAWHKKLCNHLQDIGFEELPIAPSVFSRKSTD